MTDAPLREALALEKTKDTSIKEMKVLVPSGHHVKLHGLKVITGRSLSSMVRDALDLYFQRQEATAAETRAAARTLEEHTP